MKIYFLERNLLKYQLLFKEYVNNLGLVLVRALDPARFRAVRRFNRRSTRPRGL